MKSGRWAVWIAIVAAIAVIGLILAVVADLPDSSRVETPNITEASERLVGVSLSPKSFVGGDYLAFFDKAAEVGNLLSWAGPWQDLAKPNNAALTTIRESIKRNVTPVVITGPKADELADTAYQTGMRQAVLDFVRENDVPYLGIGNEIDEFYRDSPNNYQDFINFLNQLAAEVKTTSPSTKVFTIYQLERLKGLGGGLFGGANNPNDHDMALLEGLKSFDMVAFTTYPCLIYKNPTDIPEEYYSDIANHTQLPVIFTEVGWFRSAPATGWESSAEEQADFVAHFQRLTVRINPQLLIWPFIYNQNLPAPFDHLTLLEDGEDTSPGYEAWKNYPKQNQ